MKARLLNGLRYVLARLSEASTWAGIGSLLMAFGFQFTPQQGTAVVQLAIAIAGVLAMLIPEGQAQG